MKYTLRLIIENKLEASVPHQPNLPPEVAEHRDIIVFEKEISTNCRPYKGEIILLYAEGSTWDSKDIEVVKIGHEVRGKNSVLIAVAECTYLANRTQNGYTSDLESNHALVSSINAKYGLKEVHCDKLNGSLPTFTGFH
jgi:hypothetical protein